MSSAVEAGRRAGLCLTLGIAWTWAFWIPAPLIGGPWGEPSTMLLILIGGAGLPGVALMLLFTREDKAARRAFWRQTLDPRMVGGRALAVIVLLPLGLGLLAGGLGWLIDGVGPAFVAIHVYRIDPGAFVLFLALSLFFIALPQELVWRGYALPRLQAAMPVVVAVLIVGVAQALWYLPLFLVAAAPVPGLGLGTLEFWRFMLAVPAFAVVVSWAYNTTGGSILAATLMHLTAILGNQLFQMPQNAEIYRTGFWIAFALLLLLATRGRLAYRNA